MNDYMVDLRSDTVTKPTDAMRRAMAEAEVGDDLYGEDPTAVRLEALYAEMVGKEAALFLPSGVMANQVAIRTHTKPGTWVAAGSNQHVVAFEYGGSARNAGVQFFLLDDSDGTFGLDELDAAKSTQRYWDFSLSLVCIENTHMPSGGRIWDLAKLDRLAQSVGSIPLHMDGARLFNASVASGVSVARIASGADSVMTCVSKGLGAPVGSLLAGSADFIAAARYERGVLGGQMRQVGVLAAAGIVALSTMVDRLAEDHERAKVLAAAVAERFGETASDFEIPQTNIVAFDHPQVDALSLALKSAGVLANPIGPKRMRLVTHKDLDDADIEFADKAIRNLADFGVLE